MKNLLQLKVLMYGLSGLGMEILKILALIGV